MWRPDLDGPPLLLVAGGSGLVPLMAILRARIGTGARPGAPACSRRVRSTSHLPRRARGDRQGTFRHRGLPDADAVPAGGLDGPSTARRPRHARRGAPAAADKPRSFVCGPTGSWKPSHRPLWSWATSGGHHDRTLRSQRRLTMTTATRRRQRHRWPPHRRLRPGDDRLTWLLRELRRRQRHGCAHRLPQRPGRRRALPQLRICSDGGGLAVRRAAGISRVLEVDGSPLVIARSGSPAMRRLVRPATAMRSKS